MTTQTRHFACLIGFAVAFALAGCGEMTSPHQAPPKRQVQDVVRASLPPFLSLDSIVLEPIPIGPEAVKVNFKATVTPKEDLYQVDREVEGTPPVTLLKVVQAAGTEVSLYGSIEASRTMDQWKLESPEIKIGLRQFGAPRGAFPAQSYVTGSKEASEALRQQAANAAQIERARKAAQAQRELERKAQEEQEAREQEARQEKEEREAKARQEREEKERIALEELRKKEMEQRRKEDEERQKEAEAARQKLILATVPGTRYIGTITHDDELQRRLRLVFVEQQGIMVKAEASDPDRPTVKRMFGGELVFNPQPEKGSNVAYSILLGPAGVGTGDDSSYYFGYFYGKYDGYLKLRLTDTGLQGEAKINSDFTISLVREGAPPAPPPAASPSGSPSSPGRGPDGILRPPSAQPPESPQAPQPEPPRSP
ncbi:MAG TPA: hypothetical protein VNA25_19615 [Phycisphaerae bacterium]|nr:hypothetical protein [Phycisphaerae bacterium]